MSNQQHRNYYLDLMGIQRWQLRMPAKGVDSTHNQAHVSVLDWQQLQDKVSQCQSCQLSAHRTQTVFGVGDLNADLLIVGEAPGYYEDQQGEPFVGRAGQLLNAMLKAIGLRREQVYISNVIKCRPPKNRDPKAEEVSHCSAFLERQVQLLQPKLILALGRHAAHYLLTSNLSLAKLRNKVHIFRQNDIPLIVTYHPAYLLRNPADKVKAFSDLMQVATQLRKGSNQD